MDGAVEVSIIRVLSIVVCSIVTLWVPQQIALLRPQELLRLLLMMTRFRLWNGRNSVEWVFMISLIRFRFVTRYSWCCLAWATLERYLFGWVLNCVLI